MQLQKTLQLFYNLLSIIARHFTCSLQSASLFVIRLCTDKDSRRFHYSISVQLSLARPEMLKKRCNFARQGQLMEAGQK